MAELLSPGVYVIEESSGLKPIEGVGTSTGAFIGFAERGPVDEPVLITNFTQFVQTFGSFIDDAHLAKSVYQFFQEGGRRCYVTRTVHHESTGGTISKTSSAAKPATPISAITFAAKYDGTWANAEMSNDTTPAPISKTGLEIDLYNATLGSVADGYFRVDVYYKYDVRSGEKVRSLKETFDDLTIQDVKDKINNESNYITIDSVDTTAVLNIPDTGKAEPDAPANFIFTGGTDGLTNVIPTDFSGLPSDKNNAAYGFHSFDAVDDINILVIPDASLVLLEELPEAGSTPPEPDHEKIMGTIMKSALTYCENRGDCFCIVDAPEGLSPQGIVTYKSDQQLHSTFGALYYPWLYMNHPVTGKQLTIAPSGAMAGIYARSDSLVGVHKAPAGHATGKVTSATGVERTVTLNEQDLLNPNGVNVIRPFPNAGIISWGGRTVSADSEWKYINVRRLFLFVEESINEGTQWVVFEPNSTTLWGSVKRNLVDFLTNVWRSGALFGTTPDEAFYVKVDEENNPPAERDAGRLNIEVGIAPVKPAEFVIIRISQKTQTQ